jgi:hypothetical protein
VSSLHMGHIQAAPWQLAPDYQLHAKIFIRSSK